MTDSPSKSQIFLARLAVLLLVLLLVAGLFWYGTSLNALHRLWTDLVDRPGGPMTFRFILQPVMATIAALHDGIRDARTGRPSYGWAILTSPAERGGLLKEGLIATSRIILLGLAMDLAYQVIVLKAVYPGEAVIIALALAFLPYLLLRGPIARIVRWHDHGKRPD